MAATVFFTILTGALTYILGQIALKFLIEPVQEYKKTVGRISHALIKYANIIANPGVLKEESIKEASGTLRSLSSELQSHLYLIPIYTKTARWFRLPCRKDILLASKSLIGLSNSLSTASEHIYRHNAKRIERICDALSIYLPDEERWPDESDS